MADTAFHQSMRNLVETRYEQKFTFILPRQNPRPRNKKRWHLRKTFEYFREKRNNFETTYFNEGSDQDIHLFAAINFAFSICPIDRTNKDESLHLFSAFYEYALSEIKFYYYRSGQEFLQQINDNLIECRNNNPPSFSASILNTNLANDYDLHEESIISNEIIFGFGTELPQVNSSSITHQIIELATNGNIKFKHSPVAVYHWRKHSIEDFYEYELLSEEVEILNPIQYYNEILFVLQNINFVNTNFNIELKGNKLTLVIDFNEQFNDMSNNMLYEPHQRKIVIRYEKGFEIVTYHKIQYN